MKALNRLPTTHLAPALSVLHRVFYAGFARFSIRVLRGCSLWQVGRARIRLALNGRHRLALCVALDRRVTVHLVGNAPGALAQRVRA